jgi:hypothetical protein
MGYHGSGPADLARSIAWDVLGREPHPYAYQRLKAEVIARCRDVCTVTEADVLEILLVAAHDRSDPRMGPRGELLSDAEVLASAQDTVAH